jgi:putative tRNA adenosine deaminase-associated protein
MLAVIATRLTRPEPARRLPTRSRVCKSRARKIADDSYPIGECSVAGTARDTEAYAVIVFREEQRWQVGVLPEVLTEDLDGLIAAVRQQPGENGSFALVDVADEFFVVVRILMGRVRLLLSDVTAAVAWDLAAQVLDFLDVDPPGEGDLDDVWPVGDLGVFADIGLDEMELGAILSDVDAYADETLSALARRLGFGDEYERVVDALVD